MEQTSRFPELRTSLKRSDPEVRTGAGDARVVGGTSDMVIKVETITDQAAEATHPAAMTIRGTMGMDAIADFMMAAGAGTGPVRLAMAVTKRNAIEEEAPVLMDALEMRAATLTFLEDMAPTSRTFRLSFNQTSTRTLSTGWRVPSRPKGCGRRLCTSIQGSQRTRLFNGRLPRACMQWWIWISGPRMSGEFQCKHLTVLAARATFASISTLISILKLPRKSSYERRHRAP